MLPLFCAKPGNHENIEKKELIIIDGPPGIGCPVIAALTGVDMVFVVTEPTVSGIHDLERVLGVARDFSVPAMVCINKADINLENAAKIKKHCQEKGVALAGEIPYDPIVTKAMVAEKSIVEFDDGSIASEFKKIWGKVEETLGA